MIAMMVMLLGLSGQPMVTEASIQPVQFYRECGPRCRGEHRRWEEGREHRYYHHTEPFFRRPYGGYNRYLRGDGDGLFRRER
jgi:hypothetical protein